MNNINESTTIIAADYMYLILLGKEKIMKKIVDRLNTQSYEQKKNIQYILCKIDKPCAEILDEEYIQNILVNEAKSSISYVGDNNIIDSDIDRHKKYIVFDEGVESAQCLTYADITSIEIPYYKNNNKENNWMLMELIDTKTFYKISYPILQLGEEVNPDDLISSWIINNNIVNFAQDLTIKPINIVGIKHDILVFAAYIN